MDSKFDSIIQVLTAHTRRLDALEMHLRPQPES